MKIFYLSKKKAWGLAGIFTGAGIALVLYLLLSVNADIATSVQEPVYQGNTGQKIIALTVNVDWGEEYIPAMLEEFKKQQARVTFFVTGQWAEKNPELLKKMYDEGHSIQNHGYKHLHFNSLTAEEASEQIKKAEKVIYEITGEKPRFFAPPYGEQNKQLLKVVASLDYKLIMWSVDTIDWQKPSPEIIIKRVVNKVHNDAIVLMHPTQPTVAALPGLLTALKKEGYQLETIDLLLNTDGKS